MKTMEPEVKKLLAVTISDRKKSVFAKKEFSLQRNKYSIEEVIVENFAKGFSIFLKSKYSHLIISRPERWKNQSSDITRLLTSCMEVLENTEHYAVCQPALFYGNVQREYKAVISQKKSHTYIKSIDDAFLLVKGSVASNFSPGHFIQNGEMDWNSYINEINCYGFETLRICNGYLEVEKGNGLSERESEPRDAIDLINRAFSKKTYDIGIEFSSLIPVFHGTSEYAMSILDSMVKSFQAQKASFQIIADSAIVKKFHLEKHQDYLIDPKTSEGNFYKVLFIPQQIFSLAVLEKINRICLKYIFTMHDAIALRCRYIGESLGIDIPSSLAYEYSDNVLSVSKSSAIDVESYFKERMIIKKVAPVLNTKEMASSDFEASSDYSIEDKEYILVMGNGFKHKAIEKTLNELSGSDLKIVVIADEIILGKYGDRFKILVSGQLSNRFMDKLYQNSSLILFPSLYEGFGLPVIASLQLGKRILVYNSSVNRELKKEFDKNNLVHLFDSFSGLTPKIKEVMNLPQKKDKLFAVERKWKDVGEETAKILVNHLRTPVNFNLLNARIARMREVKRIQSSVHFLNLSHIKSILKFILSILVGRIKRIFGKMPYIFGRNS